MRIALISPHFNWCNYRRPVENFCRFRESLGQPFTLYHARYLDNSIDNSAIMFAATEQNLLWQKEPIINHAIRQLPPAYEAVAWIDPDLLFHNPNWFEQTCTALEKHPVVQMFSYVRYLGPNGEEARLVSGSAHAGDQASFLAPGGAIAARREILDALPLYDRHILGGGDQIFMDACRGVMGRVSRELPPRCRLHVDDYMQRLHSLVQGDVGVVPGIVSHLWHGDRVRRRYRERHQVLARRRYDPTEDVRLGANGLLEWATDKPDLHESVYGYFKQRKEDTSNPDGGAEPSAL